MSNFDFEAYRKVFPEVKETPAEVESVVETFKPTEEALEKKAADNAAGVADEGNVEGVKDTPEVLADEGADAGEPAKGDNTNG